MTNVAFSSFKFIIRHVFNQNHYVILKNMTDVLEDIFFKFSIFSIFIYLFIFLIFFILKYLTL